MRIRLLPALLVVLLAALLAGCGGGGDTGASGGSIPAGASVVRAGVLGFVSLDTDTGSGQWQQLDDLAQKFPGRDRAIARIDRAFARHGVDYQRDVKPALGPELDLAFVRVGSTLTAQAVALTKPDDPAKLEALVAKLNADASNQDAVYREVDGWYAVADSQRTIDAALKGDAAALADDAAFKEALGKVSGDALVKAYADGPQLNRFARDAAGATGSSFDLSSLGLDTLKYAAASVAAEDDGLRLEGASKGGNLGGSNFASSLVGGIPGDAFAVFDFQGGSSTAQLDKLRSSPRARAGLRRLQSMLGVTLDELVALLRGEIALYARPGAGIPELTIALDPKDTGAALATLDKLFARLAAASGGRVQPGTQAGHEVKTVSLGQIAIHYGALDGKVLITSGVNGIAAYGGPGERFPDSAEFGEAKDAAGMPDSTSGFAFVDLKDAIPLLEGFAGLSGQSLPPEVTENLRPLRSFLAWGEGSGDTRTFDAFVEIK